MDADVSLDLRYKGMLIASYEFDELSDVNAFLIAVKAKADTDPSIVVRCRVSVEAYSDHLTDSHDIPWEDLSSLTARK